MGVTLADLIQLPKIGIILMVTGIVKVNMGLAFPIQHHQWGETSIDYITHQNCSQEI